MEKVKTFFNQPVENHILIGTFIRLALIVYAIYHDDNFVVPYTDIDYKVFTDAARHIHEGNSPYKRHTFRYSPLIAYILRPNIFLCKDFGKILFTVLDTYITHSIKDLVDHQLQWKNKEKMNLISTYCSLLWLYNPMVIAITTRGNVDSVPCFIIIQSILYLQTDGKKLQNYFLAGFFLGFSIHLRLYPIFYSFPMYLSIGNRQLVRRVTFRNILLFLVPNKKQLILALSCIATLLFLTLSMYAVYGYDFLFETYIYHLFRKDTRHNFSVLFYYSYLSMNNVQLDIVKPVVQFLEFTICFVLSLCFGYDPKTLPFCLFCQTVVLVAYNSVMTSQYFVWFMALLPLVAHNFKLSFVNAIGLIIIWVTPQAVWLFYAYLLEFKANEVFIYIWISSLFFFCANIFILSQLVKCYTPDYAFGQTDTTCLKKVKKRM